MIRAVVFDLDDTLYAESNYVLSGFDAVDAWLESNHEISGFGVIAKELFQAGRRGTIFDETFHRLGRTLNAELIGHLVTTYRSHVPRIALFPDADLAIDIVSAKYRTAIISDGYLVSQTRKVESLDLRRRINKILLTDVWGSEFWKPSPKAFLEVQRVLDVRGSECVYIADNPKKDFLAPSALGWKVIRVRRAGCEHFSTENNSADPPYLEISDLHAIDTFLI